MSLLHLCISNHQHELVSCLFEMLPTYATYDYIHKMSPEAMDIWDIEVAELPLNLAVAIGDETMVEVLINHGAEMTNKDSRGYNIFHALVFLGKTHPNKADKMYDLLLKMIPRWMAGTREFSFLKNMPFKNAFDVALWHLLKSVDKNRLTPLKLSAKLGVANILQKIVNSKGVYRFTHHHIGCKSESLYDLSEIDPYITQALGRNERASILEFIMSRPNNDTLPCVGIPPISTAVEIKWKNYFHVFVGWGVFHVSIMISFTVLLLNSLKYIQPNATTESNSSFVEYHIRPERFSFQIIDVQLIVLASMYGLYSLTMISTAYNIIIRCENKFRLDGIIWIIKHEQIVIMLLFSICAPVYGVLKILKNENEVLFLALTLLLGWIESMQFLRISHRTIFFSLMFDKILFEDMLRFVIVILLFTFAFSFATAVIFAPFSTTMSLPNWSNIVLNYIKLGMGIADFPIMYTLPNSPLTVVFYLFFIMFINLLILNLLIANMSDTFAKISTNRLLVATRVRTSDVILLEWLFPCLIQSNLAIPTRHRLLRITLPDGSVWENHVFLMLAPSPVDTENSS